MSDNEQQNQGEQNDQPEEVENQEDAEKKEEVEKKEDEEKKDEREPRIYIGNLSYDTTEESLTNAFSKFANVVKVNIPRKENGKSRGFGFVEFQNLDDAQKAINEMDGKELDGRTVNVGLSKPRDGRPPRDRDRRGGYRDRDRDYGRDRGRDYDRRDRGRDYDRRDRYDDRGRDYDRGDRRGRDRDYDRGDRGRDYDRRGGRGYNDNY